MDNPFIEVSKIWYKDAPFLSSFALHFQYEETDKIPTVGISYSGAKFKIVYNPEFMKTLVTTVDSKKVDMTESVLLHEVMHLLTLTEKRKQNRIHKVWNVATDFVINDEIENLFTIGQRKMVLPGECCRMKNLTKDGYKGSVVAEEIYDWIHENKVEYVTLDDHSELDKIDPNDIEVQMTIESLKSAAQSYGWGNMCGGMVERLKALCRPEQVPFQKVFRKKVSQMKDKGNIKAYTWKKINRRQLPLKGKRKLQSRLNVAIDTSGSCYSQDIFSKFFSEIDFISNKYAMNIYQIDVNITSKQTYKKGIWRKLDIKGGGGTVMQPLFDQLKIDKQLDVPLIFFTDGCWDTNINMHGIKPFWVLTEHSNDSLFKNKYVFKNA